MSFTIRITLDKLYIIMHETDCRNMKKERFLKDFNNFLLIVFPMYVMSKRIVNSEFRIDTAPLSRFI